MEIMAQQSTRKNIGLTLTLRKFKVMSIKSVVGSATGLIRTLVGITLALAAKCNPGVTPEYRHVESTFPSLHHVCRRSLAKGSASVSPRPSNRRNG